MRKCAKASFSTNNNTMQPDLDNILRKLWEEHIMWTRSFIISTAESLGDLQVVTKRLLRNPRDFGDVLSQYYGNEKAKTFENLLTSHLEIGGKLVTDSKNGDTAAAEIDRRNWYKNADEIADFLAGINPYWTKRQWQSMLYEHLKITEEEAALRLKKQYAEDVAIYDTIENQALAMADYMARGIKDQFKL